MARTKQSAQSVIAKSWSRSYLFLQFPQRAAQLPLRPAALAGHVEILAAQERALWETSTEALSAATDAGGLLYRWLELLVTSDAEAGNRCHSDLPLSSAFTIPDDFRCPKS